MNQEQESEQTATLGIIIIDNTNPMMKCFITIHQEAERERNYTGKNV